MHKTIIFIFIFYCIFIFQVHSQSQSIYKDNSFRYLGLEELNTYNLYGKKNNPSCYLHINFFYPFTSTNKGLQKQLQTYFITSVLGDDYVNLEPEEAIKAYSREYVGKYKDVFEKSGLYKTDENKAKSEGEDIKEYDYFYNWKRTIRNTIKFNRGNIISQVVNVYNYSGGAHGASSTIGSVYDVAGGKAITYDEIFHEDTEEEIAELLLKHLKEESRYVDENAMIEAGFTTFYFPPTNNFIADDKGITFIYNPYELGAYVLGIVEVFVPYSDLFVYMKPENTLFRWAENFFAGNKIKYETSYLNKEFFVYDKERFPGFTAQIQFTYPQAYFDKSLLKSLQKLFVTNAFGEEFSPFDASQVVEKFYEKEEKEYENYVTSDEVKLFIANEIAERNEENEEGQQYFMSLGKEFSQTNIFHYNQNDLISYEINSYSYTGGAHGMEASLGFVVQLSKAKNLSYDEIFTTDSKQFVTSLLVKNLLKSKEYQTREQLKQEGYEVDKIVPNNNFYIDNEGITFIYTPYEIGPYVLGTTKIKILYSEVADYLNIYLKK